MNHREQMMAAIKGEPTDCIPYVPRLDIWYNANSRGGTLPDPYKKATLRELTDDLDLGYHAVIPSFRDFADPDGDRDVGLGFYHHRNRLYALDFPGVARKLERLAGGVLKVEYLTPHGTIRTVTRFDEQMQAGGATLAVTLEHAVKTIDDFAAMAYIAERAVVTPQYEAYVDFRDSFVGTRGLAVSYSSVWASPVHYLLKELMALDAFYYTQNDYPEEMAWLTGKLAPFCERLFQAAVRSPAELIMSGANFDSAITTPPLFAESIAPELKRQSDILHARGKYLVCHTDGENRGLLPLYRQSGIDVADSICPSPMTSCSLEQTRRVFDGKITIWGGIPSICVLESAMDDAVFDRYLDELLESAGRGDHLIFSIADTVPPAARFDRILEIGRRIKAKGPVLPA